MKGIQDCYWFDLPVTRRPCAVHKPLKLPQEKYPFGFLLSATHVLRRTIITNIFTECLLCSRGCAKYSVRVTSGKPYDKINQQELLSSHVKDTAVQRQGRD